MNENLSFAVVDSGSGLFMKFALAEHVMFVVDDLGMILPDWLVRYDLVLL